MSLKNTGHGYFGALLSPGFRIGTFREDLYKAVANVGWWLEPIGNAAAYALCPTLAFGSREAFSGTTKLRTKGVFVPVGCHMRESTQSQSWKEGRRNLARPEQRRQNDDKFGGAAGEHEERPLAEWPTSYSLPLATSSTCTPWAFQVSRWRGGRRSVVIRER
jgi:hypothetical protein